MARIVSPEEVNPAALTCRTVAIVGYGNQGRAHALNLRDSGVAVLVCQRPGPSHDLGVADGFAPVSSNRACADADVLMFTLPDERMASVFREQFAASLGPRHTILFAHGFNVVFAALFDGSEPYAIAMVSPKGAGYGVRQRFEEGGGVPALIAVHHDPRGDAKGIALAYAAGLGCARNLILETTFREETITDLFGEQAVLCGGIPSLIEAGFQTLVDAGYSPEIAYFECLHETKLIVDLIVANGLAQMRSRISGTAAYGGLTTGPKLIDEEARRKLREILNRIESGEFAREWIAESAAGSARFEALKRDETSLAVEQAGQRVRKLMQG